MEPRQNRVRTRSDGSGDRIKQQEVIQTAASERRTNRTDPKPPTQRTGSDNPNNSRTGPGHQGKVLIQTGSTAPSHSNPTLTWSRTRAGPHQDHHHWYHSCSSGSVQSVGPAQSGLSEPHSGSPEPVLCLFQNLQTDQSEQTEPDSNRASPGLLSEPAGCRGTASWPGRWRRSEPRVDAHSSGL